MRLSSAEGGPKTLPKKIYLEYDIDGASRETQFWVFPFWTAVAMLRQQPLRPTEEQIREMIRLGSGPGTGWEKTEAFTRKDLDIELHGRRRLMPGVIGAINLITETAKKEDREVITGNLSGRKPHLHVTTALQQEWDGVITSHEQLDLNPGLGTYNHKTKGVYNRLTGNDRFVGRPGNVVMVEDDETAIQAIDALNDLPEVIEAGTQVLTYRKLLGIWSSDWLLRRAGIDPNNTATVVSFDSHTMMGYDCARRIREGLI